MRPEDFLLRKLAISHPNAETASVCARAVWNKGRSALVFCGPLQQFHLAHRLRANMATTEIVTVQRRRKYYWPQAQLNFWLLITLVAAGTNLGVFANFMTIQTQMNLGTPWFVCPDHNISSPPSPLPMRRLTSVESTGSFPTKSPFQLLRLYSTLC